LPPAAGPPGGGLAAALWLIGAPALLLAGSLGPDGFSPTNLYLRGLFGAAAWSAAVVPAAVGGRFLPGAWPSRLAWGWGLVLGAAAAVWQGGNWGDWPRWLAGSAWLLILPAGARLAVAAADPARTARRVGGGAFLSAVVGAALWVAAGFISPG
jgi:hypothetical protein